MASAKLPFKTLSKKTVFRGRVVSLEVLRLRVPSGRVLERHILRSRGVAVVIPVRPDGKMILVKQLRVATGKAIWEFPAGTFERGESAFRCAHRELQEETGWRAGRLRRALSFYPTPGVSDEKMDLFVADRLLEGTHHRPDEDEELEIGKFTPVEIRRMIERGKIVDGKTILGFFWYQGFRHLKGATSSGRSR